MHYVYKLTTRFVMTVLTPFCELILFGVLTLCLFKKCLKKYREPTIIFIQIQKNSDSDSDKSENSDGNESESDSSGDSDESESDSSGDSDHLNKNDSDDYIFKKILLYQWSLNHLMLQKIKYQFTDVKMEMVSNVTKFDELHTIQRFLKKRKIANIS